jgi:hypothetical protein
MSNFVAKNPLKPEPLTVDKKKIREAVIRATWKERGRKLWNPKTHGKGLPLNVPAKQASTSTATIWPLTPSDNLEFRFFGARGRGQPFNYIVCQGIVVESWGEDEPPGFIIAPADD